MASAVHRPTSVEALAELVAGGGPFELRGGGTRAGVGAPRDAAILDMTAFTGVIDYDPAELVLSVGAGARLSEVEALVASRGQMLAFEPHGAPGSTIGGAIASASAGPRRLSRGAARDHLLGFKGVSGRGEVLIGGAKVVKNVTGYDLPKLIAGSWGRLAALTEVTLKVLPRPAMTRTLVLQGLSPAGAIAAMAKALGSPGDVAAAGHDPAAGITALRLEGVEPSIAARQALLKSLLTGFAPVEVMAGDDADAFWQGLVSLEALGDEHPLWRIALPPSRCAETLDRLDGRWLMDWGGGLVWLASSADPAAIRAAAGAAGGHAMLARAPEAMRAAVPALHPRPRAVQALEARVRAAFDPLGVFETGRFLDASHAD